MGRYISYSPTRRAAMPLISTHAEKGVEMNPHMPTSPQNAKLDRCPPGVSQIAIFAH